MRAKLFGLGGGQVGITTVLITGIAMAFGQPWTIALAIGLVLALSSTAIVLQTLNEKGLMKSDGGQSGFSVLLFQDIAVIPMLALIPLLAMPDLMDVAAAADAHGGAELHASDTSHGDDSHAGDDHDDGHGSSMSLVDGLNGWQTALVTIGAVAAVVLGGSNLTRPVFRFISAANLRELFTATALMMVVGIALLMSLVGLSAALGTFLAGVVLANSEYRHELESDIDPFKGLLLGLFFMTVGAGINFALLSENLMLILGLTIGLMVVKGAVLYVLGTIFGLRGTDRWLLTLGLAQAGEFGFVLLSFTVANSVIPSATADLLLLVVALSMLLTPALFILYDRVIAPRYTEESNRDPDEIDVKNHIIIAGSGRIGGLVNRMLKAAGFEATVIDYSAKHLENLRTFGVHNYFGDAVRPDLLHAAGIKDAKLFIIAIDNKDQITELTRYIHQNYPHVHILVRAIDRDHVYDLWAAGSRDIVRETFDSSIRMGRSAFEAMGIHKDHAQEMADEFAKMDRKAMLAVADVHDPNIPPAENEAYVARVLEMLGPWQAEVNQKMNDIRAKDIPDDPEEAAS